MRKAIILSITTIIVAFTVYLACKNYMTIQHKNIIGTNIARLPAFSFVLQNNKTFCNSDFLNINSKIVFNYFSPTCEHCQYMATQYLKNKEQLKNINILMITLADSGSVAKFNREYRLYTLPNIFLMRDNKFQFHKIFGTATVPSFFVYENQRLIKSFYGETKIETLFK